MIARFGRRFASAREAERLWRSVRADDPDSKFVLGRVVGDRLEIEVRGPNAASVRASVDDLLACLSAAERAGVPARKRRAPPSARAGRRPSPSPVM